MKSLRLTKTCKVGTSQNYSLPCCVFCPFDVHLFICVGVVCVRQFLFFTVHNQSNLSRDSSIAAMQYSVADI